MRTSTPLALAQRTLRGHRDAPARRACPSVHVQGGVAPPLPRRIARTPDRPPPGRPRSVGPPAPLACCHPVPPRRLPPLWLADGAGCRRPMPSRGPGARCEARWRCWATSAPGDGSSTRSPCSTASTRRDGMSSGRCWRCPTLHGTSATATSSDHRESTPSPRPCTSRPSCRRRPPIPCAIPHPEKGVRVSLDVAAPASPPPYGRGDEPDPDTLAPLLSASMALRRRPLDRAGLARLLWSYPLMTTRVSSGIYAQAVRLARAAPRSTGTPLGVTSRPRPAATRWFSAGTGTAADEPGQRVSAPWVGSSHRPGATRHLALRGQWGALAGTGRHRVR